MGVLSQNSGFQHARRSHKGSENADRHVVSKKILSQKVAHWIGAQGRVKLVKNAKMPSLLRHQEKTPNPKRKIF